MGLGLVHMLLLTQTFLAVVTSGLDMELSAMNDVHGSCGSVVSHGMAPKILVPSRTYGMGGSEV